MKNKIFAEYAARGIIKEAFMKLDTKAYEEKMKNPLFFCKKREKMQKTRVKIMIFL